MRAREEKYKSRIRVLEALASGISEQTQINSSATIGKANVRCNISSSLCLRPDMNNISLSYSFLNFFSGCCRSCHEGLFLVQKLATYSYYYPLHIFN